MHFQRFVHTTPLGYRRTFCGEQAVDVGLAIAITAHELRAQLVDAGEQLATLVRAGLLELVECIGVANELVLAERRQVVVAGAISALNTGAPFMFGKADSALGGSVLQFARAVDKPAAVAATTAVALR